VNSPKIWRNTIKPFKNRCRDLLSFSSFHIKSSVWWCFPLHGSSQFSLSSDSSSFITEIQLYNPYFHFVFISELEVWSYGQVIQVQLTFSQESIFQREWIPTKTQSAMLNFCFLFEATGPSIQISNQTRKPRDPAVQDSKFLAESKYSGLDAPHFIKNGAYLSTAPI